MKTITCLLIAVLVLVGCNSTVSAATLQGTGIAAGPAVTGRDPSGFHYIAKPAARITDFVKIINTDFETKIIDLNIVEAAVSTDNRLSCPAIAAMTDKWISLLNHRYSVPGNTSILAPFAISTPVSFQSGEHQACVIAQAQQPATTAGSALSTRVAMRLTVTPSYVKPPRIVLRELTARYDDQHIFSRVNVRNVEPITAIATMKITGTGKFCRGVGEAKSTAKVLLPSTGQTLPLKPLKRPLWGGYCHIQASVQSRMISSSWTGQINSVETHIESTLLICPQPHVLIGITSALAAISIFVYVRKHLKRPRQ